MGGKALSFFSGKLPARLPFILFGAQREIVTVFKADRTVLVPKPDSRNVKVTSESRVIVVPQSETASIV